MSVDRVARTHAELAELIRSESALEKEWERLGREGYRSSQVRARLADADLGKQQRLELLRAAHRGQSAFLKQLDDLQRRQHETFVRIVETELARAVETMEAFYGKRRMWSVRAAARRLEKLSARYHELEELYGTPADHRRIAVFQRFYGGVVAFAVRIRRLDPTAPQPPAPTVVDLLYRALRGLRWLVSRAGALLHLLIVFVGLLVTVLSRRDGGESTPFTRRIDELFRTLGRVRGYRVEVRGSEHLPQAGEGGDRVCLVTPAHRHGVTDNIAFAALELPDYLVFNAVDQLPVLPRFLKDRIASTPGLIPVGKGRGPSIDRVLEALRDRVSRNVLIYPEGSVSEGFRGTRPPRRNFGESLVRRLRNEGHPLALVPVTYLDNARFLDLPPRSNAPDEKRLRVVVSPAIPAPMIDALLEAGGGEMVNEMVRLAWLEELVTDAEHLLGRDRMTAVQKRLDAELDGIRYWGSTLPAQVADRLRTRSDEPSEVLEEPFRGMRVQVIRLPDSAVDEDGKLYLPDLESPDSNELILGIRDPAHIYLNVGCRRFDGDILRPLAVKDRSYAFRGIVIRLVGVPVKSIHAIRRQLETFGGREQRTLTCANSACRVIAHAANIRIDDHADMRPFLPSHVLPTRTIRKIIQRGLRNHQGDGVDFQVYKTGDETLEQTLARMRRAELKIAWAHVREPTVAAARRVAVALRKLRRQD